MLNRHRRLLTVVAILILSLMIPLFLSLNADAQGPDGFENYEASDGSFSFQYPEEWFVSEEIGIIVVGNSESSFIFDDDMQEGDVVLLIIPPSQVDLVMGIGSSGSPTQIMERYLESTDGGSVVSYGAPEGIIIGETVAVRVEVSDFEVEGWVYMIDAGDDTVMMVVAAAPLDNFGQHEILIESIINTLRFSNASVELMPNIQATAEAQISTPLQFPTTTPIIAATLIPTISIQSSPNPIYLTATALVEQLLLSPTQPVIEVTIITPTPLLATVTQFTFPSLTPRFTSTLASTSTAQFESNTVDFAGTITALESTIAAWEANATSMNGGVPATGSEDCEVYVVQSGDNLFRIALGLDVTIGELTALNGLTENAILFVGQVLLIPSETCQAGSTLAVQTATPTMTRTPRPTVAGVFDLKIIAVDGVGDITSEAVEIHNLGDLIDLTGWTLEDEDGNVFEFPAIRIFSNASLRILSRVGQNTPVALYWNASEAIWQAGEIATLIDADGRVVSTFIVDEE